MITRSMHRRSLDLFCGTKSFSKVAYEFNYETYTLDILPKFEPTYCCDIMTWEYKQLPVGYFDVIWASPNCKDYSSMNFLSGNLNKDLTESDNFVKKVLEIIDYFKPKYWYMENPAMGKLKSRDFMKDIPFNTIDYCKYGFDNRKRTMIWNNNPHWKGRVLCKSGNYCQQKETNKKHVDIFITRGSCSSKWEHRIMVPRDLMIDIVCHSD